MCGLAGEQTERERALETSVLNSLDPRNAKLPSLFLNLHGA